MTDVVVTGIGVVTPQAAGRRRTPPPDGWFDVKTRLGPRGYKYLPAASQYMLAAARAALEDAGGGLEHVPEEARAAAVGTNSGAAALHADMDRAVIGGSSDDLSPASAPFFSINLFGSRLATEYALKGFNLTMTSPRTAGLEALETGVRCLGLGRASWLLAGATEAALDPGEPGYDMSEAGAVALVCEPREAALARGARIHGICVVRTFFVPPGCELDALDRDAVVEGGAGCLEPMLQVASALAGAEERLVVTVADEGNAAAARVVPEAARAAGERRLDVSLA